MGRCRAQTPASCPYGGSDSKETHFETFDEAKQQLTKNLQNNHGQFKTVKKRPSKRKLPAKKENTPPVNNPPIPQNYIPAANNTLEEKQKTNPRVPLRYGQYKNELTTEPSLNNAIIYLKNNTTLNSTLDEYTDENIEYLVQQKGVFGLSSTYFSLGVSESRHVSYFGGLLVAAKWDTEAAPEKLNKRELKKLRKNNGVKYEYYGGKTLYRQEMKKKWYDVEPQEERAHISVSEEMYNLYHNYINRYIGTADEHKKLSRIQETEQLYRKKSTKDLFHTMNIEEYGIPAGLTPESKKDKETMSMMILKERWAEWLKETESEREFYRMEKERKERDYNRITDEDKIEIVKTRIETTKEIGY